MKEIYKKSIIPLLLMILLPGAGICGNIDPENDGSKFAYGENIGWINFAPASGPGVTVTDSDLSGYAWAENAGWIKLDPVFSGVFNDGFGNLSGYAWGENVGWISFSCLNNSSCSQVNFGVTIDPLTGEFSGNAWGENIGWITFRSTGGVSYGVNTLWGAAVNYCAYDSDNDGDVDGADFTVFADGFSESQLVAFAAEFGNPYCF